MTDLPPPAPSTPPPAPPGQAPSGQALSGSGKPTGGSLVKASWGALKQDKSLVSLPVVGGLISLLCMIPIVVGFVAVPEGTEWLYAVLGVIGAVILAIISTFFAVALAAGAHERMNGGDPTVKSAMAKAWEHKVAVIGWALLSVTVGLVLNALQEKFKAVGNIASTLGGMAFSIASFFVVPIIASENIGPWPALKKSVSTFRDKWSSTARVQLRLVVYVLALVAAAVVAVVAVVLLASVSSVLAVVVGIVLGSVIFYGALLLGAISSYSRVALYRYSSGMPTPGIDPAAIAAAVSSAPAKA